MKKTLVLMMLAIGCSQSNEAGKTENYYREALLRTVQSYSADRNMDSANPVKIDFFNKFEGQLVELVIEASPMNTYYYSVVNSDEPSRKSAPPTVALGELKVELNGNDITPCLINECNQTKCEGQEEDILKFTGSFSTRTMYLNLTKLKFNPSCAAVSLNPSEMNSIKLSEIGSSPEVIKGARIHAQVLTYNRSYRIQDIQNLFNN